jgi:phospholipid/cholesterol/gamma-HCH transport system substrate-binding protein
MQYGKMKFYVGVFVLTLFIVIATFAYLILEEKGTFDKRYTFHFNTSTAEAFNIGMPIKFSGFNIGTIDKIELRDDGSVDMTFSVNEKNIVGISSNFVYFDNLELSDNLYHFLLLS